MFLELSRNGPQDGKCEKILSKGYIKRKFEILPMLLKQNCSRAHQWTKPAQMVEEVHDALHDKPEQLPKE